MLKLHYFPSQNNKDRRSNSYSSMTTPSSSLGKATTSIPLMCWLTTITIVVSYSKGASAFFITQQHQQQPQQHRHHRHHLLPIKTHESYYNGGTSTSSTASFRLYSNNNDNNKMYGRGSDIWPPTNQGESIRLEDSFPGNLIPDAVIEQLYSATTTTNTNDNDDNKTSNSNNNQSTKIPSLNKNKNNKINWLDRFPVVLVVLVMGWIRPLDVGLVTILSVYTYGLTLAAKSLRHGGEAPTLPSLPPQAHVPQLVQNPLQDLTYSSFGYDIWWRCGILLGFILPFLTLCYAVIVMASPLSFGSSSYALLSTTLARPLFLLSCQALSELACKDWLLPLPIRIWIPISYQIIRLVYLGLGFFGMVTTVAVVGKFVGWVQILAGLNLVYTLANVFGFLLPVALIKYMRAHFFAVEAASVTLHKGMEETIGLTPMTRPPSIITSDLLERTTTSTPGSSLF